MLIIIIYNIINIYKIDTFSIMRVLIVTVLYLVLFSTLDLVDIDGLDKHWLALNLWPKGRSDFEPQHA